MMLFHRSILNPKPKPKLMERIGDDEITSIFNKIDKKIDMKSFSQVSKQFMKVSCLRLHTLCCYFPDMLYDILPASPNLVHFYCSKPLSNSHMKLLAQSCPKLWQLNLNLVEDEDGSDLEVDSDFDFDFDSDFDDDGLCGVANACIHLFAVDLGRRVHFGDLGIDSLVRCCKDLTVLELGRCVGVTDQSLKAIGEASCIQHLYLRGCYMITDLGLMYLANENGDLKNWLDHLNLSECDKITDNGIIYLKQLDSLTYLNLSKCGVNVTDFGVVEMLSKLHDIDCLNLSWLINVTDISLFVIASNCLVLRSVYLKGCEAITREGLVAFAFHPRLEDLELFACNNFSWEDVKLLILVNSRLRYISLSRRIMFMPAKIVYRMNRCR